MSCLTAGTGLRKRCACRNVHVETFAACRRSLHSARELAQSNRSPSFPAHDDRRDRRADRRVGADGVEGDQRPVGRVGRDAPARRDGDPRARLPPIARLAAAAPLLELIFHELESEWALEIVRGVEQVAGQHHLAVVLTEMQGRRTTGRGWIEGVLARRPTGVIAVFSDLSETMREQLRRAASRSSSSTRPASRSTTRRRSARRTGTAA